MNVLVLGGTGTIGREVVRALARRAARVSILCRSDSSAAGAEALGARPVRGDITAPDQWISRVASFDAVVQAAATFDERMGRVDSQLLERLVAEPGRRRRLLYTGGGWLYGDCPAAVDESAGYAPPHVWRWLADNARRVTACGEVEGVVVHPGNVVEPGLGVPPILLNEARDARGVRVPAPPSTTWPLVDPRDLGEFYALALEHAPAGEAFIGCGEAAVALDRLARRVERETGHPRLGADKPLRYWTDKYGEWAAGYALSQNLCADKARRCLGWQPRFRYFTEPSG